MVKPHSMDLREHAMQRLATGETTYQVAAALNVAVSSVIKWAQKQRKSGSVEPGKMGGHKPFIIDGEHKSFVLNHIKKNPATSLLGLSELLEQRGLKVHTSSISRFLQREDIQLKKDQPLEVSQTQAKAEKIKLDQPKLTQPKPVQAKQAQSKLEFTKAVPVKSAVVQQAKKLTLVAAQAELMPVAENNQTYEQAQFGAQAQFKAQFQDKSTQESLLPQIELFQFDVKLPLTPVIAGFDMLQTLLKCRTQMVNSYSEAVKDFYSAMWKR
jgi:putative transposase